MTYMVWGGALNSTHSRIINTTISRLSFSCLQLTADIFPSANCVRFTLFVDYKFFLLY